MKDSRFILFSAQIAREDTPTKLNNPFDLNVPKICQIAKEELIEYLERNQFMHKQNFGWGMQKDFEIRGKMFGVLVVKDSKDDLGYLAAYSGKLNTDKDLGIFVPSVFDISSQDDFLTKGMIALGEMGKQIKILKDKGYQDNKAEIDRLITLRRESSIDLQNKLFDQYFFMNERGESKNLVDIFLDYAKRKPASGSGECAGPKLLQYAFERRMKPLAIAEFWWGRPRERSEKEHGQFYPACEDKCRPILSYMLGYTRNFID